jgi:hypothetical protein
MSLLWDPSHPSAKPHFISHYQYLAKPSVMPPTMARVATFVAGILKTLLAVISYSGSCEIRVISKTCTTNDTALAPTLSTMPIPASTYDLNAIHCTMLGHAAPGPVSYLTSAKWLDYDFPDATKQTIYALAPACDEIELHCAAD